MKAIVLDKPGSFSYTDITMERELQANEALVKVHRIGICGTDLHAYRGHQPFFTYPRILGHELGVEVVQLGKKVANVAVGDRCAVEPYLNATQDQAVRRGFTNCGENLSVLGVHEDGGMREHFVLPACYLHASDKLSYEQLAVIEPLGIGCHAVNRASIQPDDLVLVVGAGPIGLATTLFAHAKGAKTVVMDVNEARLEFARQTIDIHATVVAGREDTLTELQDQFGGDLPTIVLDATGNKYSMAKALEYAAPAGKIVFIGLFQGDFSFNDPYFHKKELTIMASRNALPADFKQIISMMEKGSIDVDRWITHRTTFEDMVGQFDHWLEPDSGVIKAVVSV